MWRIGTILTLLSMLFVHSPAFAADKKVVASVLPVWVFASNVAGERAEVSLLIRSGTDPHEFTLKPSDLKKLDEADLVLISGAGLENNFIRGIDPEKTFDTSEGIELIMLGKTPDPHIWLDPVTAQAQVENIALALSDIDPEGKNYYRENAESYNAKLAALHKEIVKGLSILAAKHLITYHESFNYFARRYGLEAYSLTGPDAEAPLPKRMSAIYDIVRNKGIPAVFEEAQFKPGALDRMGRDLGVRVCTLTTIASNAPSSDLYEKAMTENLNTIIDCLGSE
jgi:zinc transport system substrate-binding protein